MMTISINVLVHAFALAFSASVAGGDSQLERPPKPVQPIDGALVIAGHGQLPDSVMDAFLRLGGAFEADIAIVAIKNEPRSAARWRERGARSVTVVGREPIDDMKLTLALLEADGVWFEDAAQPLQKNRLFTALLHGLLARGGVVGGGGAGAAAVVGSAESPDISGFGLLPLSIVHLPKGESEAESEAAFVRRLRASPGHVGWTIPPATAAIVHHGRRVAAIGERNVVLRVVAKADWPERRKVVDAIDVFDYGDQLDYEVDLLSWLRSAQNRTRPIFPPKSPAAPRVAKGTLILSGGGGVQSPTWRRFIRAAGGKDAPIICIPSAGDIASGEPRSYSARELREHGAENVTVLHTSDPRVADRDPKFLAKLETARGVWIDGGRTYRVMDIFENTRAHDLIRAVLERGGVVGGSSAGCQVAGDFLVRGDPRTNRTLAFPGYTRGLGLLPGVIIDAHFRQRDRQEVLGALVELHPQMLGIGIDEDTAIVLRGSVVEVLGQEAVSFYDAGEDAVVLREGERYDLVERAVAE